MNYYQGVSIVGGLTNSRFKCLWNLLWFCWRCQHGRITSMIVIVGNCCRMPLLNWYACFRLLDEAASLQRRTVGRGGNRMGWGERAELTCSAKQQQHMIKFFLYCKHFKLKQHDRMLPRVKTKTSSTQKDISSYFLMPNCMQYPSF